MSTKTRGTIADLIEQIEKSPTKFSYVQLIRLLRLFLRPTSQAKELFKKDIFVRPVPSLSFPGTDVYSIKKTGPWKYNIEATFLGLYGPSSPIPVYYTEEIIEELLDEKDVKRDFLDIFNHPFYELFIKIWWKYRIWLKVLDEDDKETLNFIFSFLGFDFKLFNPRENLALLRLGGIFAKHPRSALGLRAIVSDMLDEEQVEVRQGELYNCKISKEERCFLGKKNCLLGENLFLGEEILTCNLKIEIRTGPLKRETFLKFLPGSPGFDRLRKYIHLYMDGAFECSFVPILPPCEAKEIDLGGHWCLLGVNTWLYNRDLYKGNLKGIWKI